MCIRRKMSGQPNFQVRSIPMQIWRIEGVEIQIFLWIFLASWEKQLQGIKDKGKKEFFDFGVFQTHHKFVESWRGPLYGSKKSFSVYRVHGIQNNRLELTVSTQQSVLKNMHRILSYWSKCHKIRRFGLASPILTRFNQYLGIQCIYFKTDCFAETVSSSRSF